ncbi:hypothetical protein [Flammeovirga sp. SubArs3]|uniref:hypothetical protein n=1 Tax=Flammeovirga sp. SubArs3 TaxID=2995316 RepID=UPI00248CE76C|nr:hypothetical protein [Flammeovirga sp. SubArs3]
MKKYTAILYFTLFTLFGGSAVYAQDVLVSKQQSKSMLEYYTLNQFKEAWKIDRYNLFFSPEENIKGKEFKELKDEVENWITYWKTEQASTNKSIVKKLFNKTRQQFFKNYSECSTFSNMLETGTYDCLTGTLLFAHIFEELGYEYKIKQLNSHVYILLQDPILGETLIESTDVYGYINNERDINEKIKSYESRLQNSLLYEKYGMNLNEDLSIIDIAGLQYYNQAVHAYRNSNMPEAQLSLYKASIVTDSPRVIYLQAFLEDQYGEVQIAK